MDLGSTMSFEFCIDYSRFSDRNEKKYFFKSVLHKMSYVINYLRSFTDKIACFTPGGTQQILYG